MDIYLAGSRPTRRAPSESEVVEHRRERVAPVQLLRRLRVARVHEHDEACIRREQGHLALRVTLVGAVGVGVDKLADRQPVGSFLG